MIRVAPLQAGVRLTAIFDSCHSGSALDLPYLYSTQVYLPSVTIFSSVFSNQKKSQGVLKEPNLLRESADGLLNAIGSYSRGDIGGVISSGISIFKRATTGTRAEEKAKRTRTSAADVIQWSGSKDHQTSSVSRRINDCNGSFP